MTDAGSAAPIPTQAAADLRRMAVAVVLASGLLFWGAANAWPFFADDAYISLRYAARLLAGHGLTWNDGERVEGYSNLLWTLSCAGLGALGVDLATAARALGIGCMLATIALLARRFRGTWPGALVAPLFAATPALPVWTIGGLELPLVWLAVTGALLQVERALAGACPRRALLAAGAWFAVADLARPDAPLFAAVAAGFVALAARRAGGTAAAARALGWLLLLPAALLLAQLAFRLAYYGDYVPNTARVKLGFSFELLGGGIRYLGWSLPAQLSLLLPAAATLAAALLPARARALLLLGAGGYAVWILATLANGAEHFVFRGWPWLGLAQVPLLLLLAAAAPRLHAAPRAPAALLAVTALLWAGYLASVGGDIFPGWRLLSPALPPLALLAGLGAEQLGRAARPWPALGAAAIALATATARIAAHFDPETRRAAAERWEDDYRQAATTLAAAFAAQQPLLAVNAAGALCYFSRLPSLDMYGLNDRAIARDPYPAAGEGRGALGAAHRRGRPEYLLARAPDLVNFDAQPFPEDAGGRALLDDPRFHRGYRCVFVRCGDRSIARPDDGEYLLPFWVRVDGRIGVARDGSSVRVPAWLLGSYRLRDGLPLPATGEPAALLRWANAADVVPWLGKSAVARLQGGALVLEVRRGDLHALRGLHLDAGSWRGTLEPEVPGCAVELADADGTPLPRDGDGFAVGGAQADDVQLCVRLQPIAVLPLRIAAIVLERRR